MAERLAYSINEVAETLGVSRDLVFDLLRRGDLHSIKVGRRRIIPADALDKFLNAAA